LLARKRGERLHDLFGIVRLLARKRGERLHDLFGIGASWGGFESLIQPMYPERPRTATKWDAEGPGIRIHIGLEDPQDLMADLAQGLEHLRKAS
jgi:cystathionine beta-lyase/cystathionine gamma-synthase